MCYHNESQSMRSDLIGPSSLSVYVHLILNFLHPDTGLRITSLSVLHTLENPRSTTSVISFFK